MLDSKFGISADEDLKERLKDPKFKKEYEKFIDEDKKLIASINKHEKE